MEKPPRFYPAFDAAEAFSREQLFLSVFFYIGQGVETGDPSHLSLQKTSKGFSRQKKLTEFRYLIPVILFWRLTKQVNLLPPKMKDLQFERFLKNGILLLARAIAVTFCVTLAASMAARLGSTPMAAFQIRLQVWMTSSLLADGLVEAGQEGTSNCFRGLMLILCYLIVAASFFVHEDPSSIGCSWLMFFECLDGFRSGEQLGFLDRRELSDQWNFQFWGSGSDSGRSCGSADVGEAVPGSRNVDSI
ncbi:hypothetical protein PTKIN_Ptkin09bG0196000 [Pterospermum kingtungense]